MNILFSPKNYTYVTNNEWLKYQMWDMFDSEDEDVNYSPVVLATIFADLAALDECEYEGRFSDLVI